MPHDHQTSALDSLAPGRTRSAGPSRRIALQAALGAGYAAAALPGAAQTAIRTPADGLDTGDILVEVGGFQVPAYRAAPRGRTGLPVVLVVHEIFGVNDYIADTVRRLAHAGYLAIAPELYARQGDPSTYGEMARLLSEVVSQVPDAQVLADLDGMVRWAGAHGGDVRKLAVTGFCWGGRISWLYAAQSPVQAAVAWYGRLVGSRDARMPTHPIDLADRLQGPVLGLYGADDQGIPVDTVEAMRTALAAGNAAARASRLVLYPDTPHAFHADYRPSYRKPAAEDGWRRMLDWFKTHGVA